MQPHFPTIYLIRHGETEWSLSGQHTGTTDIPLTEQGKIQATLLGRKLQNYPFKTVLCSPLKRALMTCELANLSSQKQIEPLLKEWNYGDYEGLTTSHILKKDPSWNVFKEGAPHGESPEQVQKRAMLLLEKLSEVQGDVALISHGHFLRALATVWLGLPIEAGTLFFLSPASVSILGHERHIKAITLWNSTFHLHQ